MKLHMTFLSLLVACGLVFSISAQANDFGPGSPTEDTEDFANGLGGAPDNADSVRVTGVKVGMPRHAGSGCPAGTLSATLSPDAKTLSMLFDNYMVEAGDSSGTRRSMLDCQLVIPVDVPNGYQVSVVKLDYRGFNLLPNKAVARYDAVYFFTDTQTGHKYRKKFRRKKEFRGPVEEEYAMSSKINKREIWSACGRSFDLNINTSIWVQSQTGEDALATLDSIDSNVEEYVDYHLVWRACSMAPPSRPPRFDPRNPGRPGPGRGNGPPNGPGRPRR
ncbi:MAG: DUF4360 domain-containing protein [Bdellovibrionaceae bacterium]|nr:DUF4360 domain-containing protein [Bdellovibrionales bacterium]MCB9083685.1 DUF4360 domain-containing protein [Pseudobdellovibrionaceae bacterium]